MRTIIFILNLALFVACSNEKNSNKISNKTDSIKNKDIEIGMEIDSALNFLEKKPPKDELVKLYVQQLLHYKNGARMVYLDYVNKKVYAGYRSTLNAPNKEFSQPENGCVLEPGTAEPFLFVKDSKNKKIASGYYIKEGFSFFETFTDRRRMSVVIDLKKSSEENQDIYNKVYRYLKENESNLKLMYEAGSLFEAWKENILGYAEIEKGNEAIFTEDDVQIFYKKYKK